MATVEVTTHNEFVTVVKLEPVATQKYVLTLSQDEAQELRNVLGHIDSRLERVNNIREQLANAGLVFDARKLRGEIHPR